MIEGVSEKQRQLLVEIFDNTEALEKIIIKLDLITRDMIITYIDLDDEWFQELLKISEPEKPE